MTSYASDSVALPKVVKRSRATVSLCFMVAVLEGLDIQAMGVAAPKLAAELQLSRESLGRALAASNIGLVIGANIGGWLADRFGRKPVLIGATASFGLFTLLTMIAGSYELLFAARLCAGLGFGAALANIMAMSVEVGNPGQSTGTSAMMFCGMPTGGGTVALISWLTPNQDWRILFLIGGLTPLLITPLLMLFMQETHRPSQSSKGPRMPSLRWLAVIPLYLFWYRLLSLAAERTQAASLAGMALWLAILPTVLVAYTVVHRRALFDDGRTLPSILIWICFLPTLLVLFLILNWLPTLVVAKGFPAYASLAAVLFNYTSIVGAFICGRSVDRFGMRWPLAIPFAGLVATLAALSRASTLWPILALSGAAGFFLIGANYALYGVAALYYPEAVRGRGSGAAMAWGRLGSVGGTLIGGYLLGGGTSAGGVVFAMIPFAVVAGTAAVALSFIPRR